jgi:hypothetical protein
MGGRGTYDLIGPVAASVSLGSHSNAEQSHRLPPQSTTTPEISREPTSTASASKHDDLASTLGESKLVFDKKISFS